jgi:hypothetical protein
MIHVACRKKLSLLESRKYCVTPADEGFLGAAQHPNVNHETSNCYWDCILHHQGIYWWCPVQFMWTGQGLWQELKLEPGVPN